MAKKYVLYDPKAKEYYAGIAMGLPYGDKDVAEAYRFGSHNSASSSKYLREFPRVVEIEVVS